jgi:PAS domain S-box-containing protein
MREDHPTVPEETGASSKSRAFSSIQGRLVSLLLFVLVPILVAQAYFSYDRYQSAKRVEVDANLDLARATAKAFDTFVQDVLHQELAIGLAFTSSETLSEEEKSRILLESRADNQAIWHFFWDNPGGIVAAATGSQFIGMDVSDREFYREIVAGKDWVVSDLILSKTTQQPSFTISRGIRNERGELLGIIVAGILPAKLDRVLAVKRPGDAGVSLLDSKGMNAYRYPAVQYTWEQRNWLKLYPFLEQVAKGKEFVDASHESKIQRGTKRIVAFTPVPSIGWIASCSRSEKETVGPIISATLQETGLFLLVALITLLTAFALSRTISSSVKILRNHALSIGRGGKYNPLTISGPTEIRDLAEAFNIMAEGLRFREEALRESAMRWAVTLGSIGDGVIASDTDGRVTFLNPMAEVLTGWSQAEAAGKPVKEVFRVVNEYTRAVVEDPVSKALQTGLVVGLANHTVLLRKDGGELPIDDSGAPICGSDGRAIGVVLIFRDITERKQAEEALRESESFYRQTLESIPGMVFTTRPDGYCDYQSQQWVGYTGIPLSEHLGDGWNQLLHPDDRSRAFEAWRSAVDGLALYDLEYRVRRHGGAYEWFRVIGRPIRDASGEIVRWFGVAMNIEDLKQVEQELRRLNETLEQRVAQRTELAEGRAKQLQALSMELIEVEEQERQRIAALLHDDLQQVLAAARLQLQAACETIPSAPMLESVEQLLVESIRKSRHLSHELSPPVLHHSGLVASLEWLTQQMKAKFGLQVQLESDGAQQFESPLLKVFLFRAVQELLFNVVKHARVKTAQVALSSSDGCLAVSVTDQGQGFDLGILDSITTLGGLGLLSLKERANYIGGSLSMESAAGKGSSFTLKVPINMDKAEKIDHPTTDLQDFTPAKSALPADRGGIRLLFVDDHQVMRQGLIRLVNGQPLIQVVGEAANGREAIERVRQLRPNVVLMDVSMPEMDGIEATRRIKVEWPEVRVIGLSMFDDENTSQRMRDAGAEIFMSKTTSPAELLKAIYGTAPIRTSLPALKSAD